MRQQGIGGDLGQLPRRAFYSLVAATPSVVQSGRARCCLLAPAFWGEIVPRIVERMLPPPQPTPAGAMYDYRVPQPPYGPLPPQRDMRPPLPRHAPVAQAAPIPVEPEPMPEAAPEAMSAPPPAVIPAPAAPSPFEEFCAANPSAPPCRSRVRGQR